MAERTVTQQSIDLLGGCSISKIVDVTHRLLAHSSLQQVFKYVKKLFGKIVILQSQECEIQMSYNWEFDKLPFTRSRVKSNEEKGLSFKFFNVYSEKFI